MPEYGLFNGFTRSDIDRPPDFPLTKILEQEAARQKQTQEAQRAAIDTAMQIRQLQNQLNEYHAQYEALEKDYRAQRAKDSQKAFQQNIISGIICGVAGSVLGGLVVYYWPTVELFFTSLIH